MHFLKVLPTALTAALIATAGSAFAAGNLIPGQTINSPADAGAIFSLTPLASEIVPFASPVGSLNPYTGLLVSEVENEGAANPLGGLTFLYAIHNNTSSSETLASLAANGFAGFDTSAYFDSPDGGSIAPSSIRRTVNGSTIKFSFFDANGNENIAPGAYTYLVAVRTNAHNYTTILNGIRDGVETNAPSYAPAAVPEASTTVSFGLLLALGLGGAVLTARRRKASAL